MEQQAVVDQFNACANAWNTGASVEFQLHITSGDTSYLQRQFEILQQYLESNCVGIGARLASLPGAQAWCFDMLTVASIIAQTIQLLDFEPYFNRFAKTEFDGFIASAGC